MYEIWDLCGQIKLVITKMAALYREWVTMEDAKFPDQQ